LKSDTNSLVISVNSLILRKIFCH